MLHIGCHLSVAGGFLAMGKLASSIGADTFQCFLRNPRGASAKTPDWEDISALNTYLKQNRFAPFIAHAPYTMNACSSSARVRELAYEMLTGDLAVMEQLPGNYYNFHPGSHLGQGTRTAEILIADLLNRCLTPGQSTIVLLETMSGKGTEVGRSFEELARILERLELPDKAGICIDTCHLSDAGYDVRHDLNGILEEFDCVIGLSRLLAVHINDSLNPPGSRKDRHARIGEGSIGLPALVNVLTHPALRGLPFILETPNDTAGHKREIALLRQKSALSGKEDTP